MIIKDDKLIYEAYSNIKVVTLKEDRWNYFLETPIDRRTIKSIPDLSEKINFSQLKRMQYINVYKAIQNTGWQPEKDIKYNPYANHVGSLEQAQCRYYVFEENGWRIYWLTVKLEKIYPKLLIDNMSGFNHTNRNILKQLIKQKYSIAAYINTAELGGLSLVILNPNCIL